jgi:hypothetical protein
MPLGREISENEDWVAYLRDVVVRPDAHPELATGGLPALEVELRGTPHAARFADAALTLVETGSPAEADAAQVLAIHAAPDATARLRALVARPDLAVARRLKVACALLLAVPQDAAGIAAIRDALGHPQHRVLALLAAARHLPEWPAQLLGLAPTDEDVLLELWKATPAGKRRAFCAAVDVAGPAHLEALIAGARRLVRVNRELATPLMMMLGPYLPDPTTGEILVETVLENMRAHRQDPSHRHDAHQAELAERMLNRRELWPKKDGSSDD